MGGGSTDSASTRSPDTSKQMDDRDDEDDLADSQQERVSEYADEADDRRPAGAGGDGDGDDESEGEGEEGFPGWEEFKDGDADIPDDPDLPGGDDEADALDDISVAGGSADLDEMLADEQPETYSDQRTLEDLAVDGAAAAESPAEFARTVFDSGAVATRYRDDPRLRGTVTGADGAFPPAERDSFRFGGWSDYDPDEASSFTLLPDTSDATGRTARYMGVADLSSDDATGTVSAYISHYDDDFRPHLEEASPERRYAHRQMAGYAFADSVGARVPPHTFNKAEDWVATGGIVADPVSKLSTERAERVDREEFIDQMAVQLLAGNGDLHSSNVFVGEDGGVHCVDMDMAGHELDSYSQVETAAVRATGTAGRIDRRRSDTEPMDVSEAEIADRAQEIAVSLHVSGQKERVFETLDDYDQIFDGYVSAAAPAYGDRIKQNVEGLITDAQN